jgi:hypothetical protein
MKKTIAVIATLFFALIGKAQDWSFGYDRTITNIKAAIHFLNNNELVVIIPNDNPNQRYIASNLPEEFKKEGLRVTMSGDVGIIPPNMRMMGTPLKLKCICITKVEQKKFALKKRKYSFK